MPVNQYRVLLAIEIASANLFHPIFEVTLGDVSFVLANATTLPLGGPFGAGPTNTSGITITDNEISVDPPACKAIGFRAGGHRDVEIARNVISDYQDTILSNPFGGGGTFFSNVNFDIHDNVLGTPAADPGCFFADSR